MNHIVIITTLAHSLARSQSVSCRLSFFVHINKTIHTECIRVGREQEWDRQIERAMVPVCVSVAMWP